MKDVQTQSCFCTVDQFSQTPPRELKLVYDVTEKYRTPVLYENKRKTETGEKHIPIYRKVTIRSEGRSKSRAKRVAMVDLSEAMVKCIFFIKIILSYSVFLFHRENIRIINYTDMHMTYRTTNKNHNSGAKFKWLNDWVVLED